MRRSAAFSRANATQLGYHTHAHTHISTVYVREFQKKTTHDRTLNANNKGKKKLKKWGGGVVNKLGTRRREQEGLIKRGPKRNV